MDDVEAALGSQPLDARARPTPGEEQDLERAGVPDEDTGKRGHGPGPAELHHLDPHARVDGPLGLTLAHHRSQCFRGHRQLPSCCRAGLESNIHSLLRP